MMNDYRKVYTMTNPYNDMSYDVLAPEAARNLSGVASLW